MSEYSQIYPALVMVAWTCMMLMLLAVWRGYFARARQDELDPDVLLYNDAVRVYPKKLACLLQNVRNQFEVPVLFYFATTLAVVLDRVSVTTVVLGWGFVVFRILHSYLHVNGFLLPRGGAFLAAFALLLVLFLAILRGW